MRGDAGAEREPVAIVGIGCRFPASSGPAGYWQTLCDGKDTIGPIPRSRWDADALFDPDPASRGKMVARTGGFLDDIEGFDWRAFRVSPREAKYMDPQHRLLLEVAWEALEDAGMPFEKLAGTRTAVFVGIMWNDYGKLQALDLEGIDGYSASGNAFAFAANRISFFFDLKGPSVALDVSCASSLIAVHLACESIWSGESSMAIAGGVNLIIAPDSVIAMSKAGILSAEGHCKPFDASADGFVRGEGAGVVLLKPLSVALADGDRIHAVIRGTAAMHSGKTDWIMAPSSSAQEQVYREAYRRAGVDPTEVDYVELHGTGTRKGDPLEAKSVAAVMGAGSGRPGRCIVGSVKTNLGHLDSAAGIAGLIKAALALEHRQIPGSLHLKNVNPEIDLDALGLDFRSALGPWPEKEGRRIAGVTGLSFGGGNVHVVLEEAPPEPTHPHVAAAKGPFLLPVSARAEGALRTLATQYRDLLSSGTGPHELCAAASVHRTHHPLRLSVTGRTGTELAEALTKVLADPAQGALGRGASVYDAPVFVFSGQGPQWWGMGRSIIESEPVFREMLERVDEAVARHTSLSIIEELRRDEASTRVHETRVAQPLIFAIQLALAALLESWGVKPQAVVGHSVGEIAAACVAGALTLEDGARIAACRGRIMHAASDLGSMVQVSITREEADALVAPFGVRLGVAAQNGPRTIVLSGETDAVSAAIQTLKQRGATARLLPVRYAFHSAVMTRFQGELVGALEGIRPSEPRLPFVSTLLGRRPNPGEAFTEVYWARQMREPVEFMRAVSVLAREGRSVFVEMGPHPVLAASMIESLGDGHKPASVLPTLVRGEEDRLSLLSTLGALYSRGLSVAWSAVASGRTWATLPTYPWQKEKLWIERGRVPSFSAAVANSKQGIHPLLQVSTKLAKPPGAGVWETVLDLERFPYLRDHRLAGSAVVPASLFIEMIVAASTRDAAVPRCVLRDVELRRALVLAEGDPHRVQLLSTVDDDGLTHLELWSRSENRAVAAWVMHVSAVLEAGPLGPGRSVRPPPIPGEPVQGADLYAVFRRAGEEYGSSFQGIRRLWKTPTEIVAELAAPPAIAADVGAYVFHPALLDACMHCMAAASAHDGESGFMPTRFDRIEVFGRGGARMWAQASVSLPSEGTQTDESGVAKASVLVKDEQGRPVLDVQGISLQYLDGLGAHHDVVELTACYDVAWRPMATEPAPVAGPKGRWLILGRASSLGAALSERLERDGHSTTLTEPTAAALATCLETGEPCLGVVLLAEALPTMAVVESVPPDSALALPLVEILRVLSELPREREARLFVVTRGGQRTAAGAVDPRQGILWGLGRSIAAEYPSLWGGLIDAELGASTDETVAELHRFIASPRGEDQVALRSGTCLAARLSPLVAPEATDATPLLVGDAAYLVTGGFGALGRAFARWLLENGARHVILLSRSRPSPEHAKLVAELSALGGTVHHAVADVADEAEMRSVLGALKRDGVPEVRGVLHAAGTVALQPIASLTAADIDEVFRAKVSGSWVLDQIFATVNLRFFVLFSSASAILQSASLGAYAAANAYQDALAHARRARGQHALTVDWGPWAGEGMAKDTGVGRGPLALRGMGAIAVADGTALMKRFLELDLTQVCVLPIDWAAFRSAYASFERSPFLSELSGSERTSAEASASSKASGLEVLPGGAEKSRRERIELYLLHRAARALHTEPETLNAESTLIELGLDSLMLVELRLEIERALGVRLRLMDLLSDPSIRELSSNLEPQVKDVA